MRELVLLMLAWTALAASSSHPKAGFHLTRALEPSGLDHLALSCQAGSGSCRLERFRDRALLVGKDVPWSAVADALEAFRKIVAASPPAPAPQRAIVTWSFDYGSGSWKGAQGLGGRVEDAQLLLAALSLERKLERLLNSP